MLVSFIFQDRNQLFKFYKHYSYIKYIEQVHTFPNV